MYIKKDHEAAIANCHCKQARQILFRYANKKSYARKSETFGVLHLKSAWTHLLLKASLLTNSLVRWWIYFTWLVIIDGIMVSWSVVLICCLLLLAKSWDSEIIPSSSSSFLIKTLSQRLQLHISPASYHSSAYCSCYTSYYDPGPRLQSAPVLSFSIALEDQPLTQ